MSNIYRLKKGYIAPGWFLPKGTAVEIYGALAPYPTDVREKLYFKPKGSSHEIEIVGVPTDMLKSVFDEWFEEEVKKYTDSDIENFVVFLSEKFKPVKYPIEFWADLWKASSKFKPRL